jgi:alanine-glyoxylate transaminase/serine-glyoxylate transaminase/serine-pyruvate transaminase
MAAMNRQSVSIYSGELVDMTDGLLTDLKKVAGTDGFAAIYLANGHGAWEAALRNTLNSGDQIAVLSNGFFSHRWGEVAQTLGVEVQYLDYGMAEHADPAKLEALLRNDTDGRIKAVLAVQTETSSSVCNDIPALRAAITAAGHGALFMVDCIAALGCDRFEMDEWGVDVMVSAGQKGIMNPIGLSFVFFNDKADAARANTTPGQYLDWTERAKSKSFYPRWSGSPPAHHMFALRETLDMMLYEEGMEAVWARHATISKAVAAAVEAWGATGTMTLNISDPAYRASGVTTINTVPGVAMKIRSWCEENAGVTLGNSLGFPEVELEDHFRIGHMGHLNIHMVMGVLGAVETAMHAQNIPHGAGALSAAARILAAHPNT